MRVKATGNGEWIEKKFEKIFTISISPHKNFDYVKISQNNDFLEEI